MISMLGDDSCAVTSTMNERIYDIPANVAPGVRRRLADATTWCSTRIALGNALRTPELRPDNPFVLEHRLKDGTGHFEFLDAEKRLAAVERLGMRRDELLRLHTIEVANPPLNLAGGAVIGGRD